MISVDDLSFTFPGARAPTIDRLSFSVAKGEVYALPGPSGGQIHYAAYPDGAARGFSGKAAIFGQPIETFGRVLYERIGVSFELPAVYLRLTALKTRTRDPM